MRDRGEPHFFVNDKYFRGVFFGSWDDLRVPAKDMLELTLSPDRDLDYWWGGGRGYPAAVFPGQQFELAENLRVVFTDGAAEARVDASQVSERARSTMAEAWTAPIFLVCYFPPILTLGLRSQRYKLPCDTTSNVDCLQATVRAACALACIGVSRAWGYSSRGAN